MTISSEAPRGDVSVRTGGRQRKRVPETRAGETEEGRGSGRAPVTFPSQTCGLHGPHPGGGGRSELMV